MPEDSSHIDSIVSSTSEIDHALVGPVPDPRGLARHVTLAERRSVVLPATSASLSSPFAGRISRLDPILTAKSIPESVEADTQLGDRTGGMQETRSEASEGVEMVIKHNQLTSAIKALQSDATILDLEAILAWNKAAAPLPSSRLDQPGSARQRDKRIREVTWPLDRQQASVGMLVTCTIQRETLAADDKVQCLRKEYLELDEEWNEHCHFLDQVMEERGPPPADILATPGATAVITPGPVLTAPSEDLFGPRINRRRGVGDAVTTEAEFQEILAGLADTAAKDPNFRASKTTAVVPNMIVGAEKMLRYHDENDLVTDPINFYDFAGTAEPIWTDQERAIFLRRYLAYPKQFGRIAEGLFSKSASDCVLYYYRTKRTIDYKSMLASRRGDKKKKAIPITKAGKSSALLANLDRHKPIVNPTSSAPQGPKSVITPVRATRDDGSGIGMKARRVRMMPETPGLGGIPGRRRRGGEDYEQDSSKGQSPEASEAPEASAANTNTRMTVKAPKRPRISSVSGSDVGLASIVVLPAFPTTDADIEAANGRETGAELLPPVKRAGKRRKVVESNTSADGATGEKPARRTATNSYWCVDEKRKFRELVAIHGTNVKAIASELEGKSERQVANFFDAHREAMRPDDGVSVGGARANAERLATGDKGVSQSEVPIFCIDSKQMPIHHKPALYARSIYDVYPSLNTMHDHRYAEPRMGMYPPDPHLVPPPLFPASHRVHSQSQPESPVKPISRPGGMRISALLNDNGDGGMDAKIGTKGTDPDGTESDGTVSERDVDGIITKASPRSADAGLPASSWSGTKNEGRTSTGSLDRPLLDRFRSDASRSPYEFLPPAWPRRRDAPEHHSPIPRAAQSRPPFSQHPTRIPWERSPSSSVTHPPLPVFSPRVHEPLRGPADRDDLVPLPRDKDHTLNTAIHDRPSDWRGFQRPSGDGSGTPPKAISSTHELPHKPEDGAIIARDSQNRT